MEKISLNFQNNDRQLGQRVKFLQIFLRIVLCLILQIILCVLHKKTSKVLKCYIKNEQSKTTIKRISIDSTSEEKPNKMVKLGPSDPNHNNFNGCMKKCVENKNIIQKVISL